MLRLVNIIFLLFVTFAQIWAQNPIHLCVGSNHNFSVPYMSGSVYLWQVQADTPIASISSGNGTEHIIMDLNNSGVFKLFVEETDINGCIGYDSLLVEIHKLPSPNISANGPTYFCEGGSVRLDIDSSYISQSWNNGTSQLFTFIDTSGSYYVNVTDSNGCSNNSNIINIDVYPNPIPDFIIDGICINEKSYFTNNSYIVSGNIVSSIWQLGNGDIISGDSVVYSHTNSGDYFIKLLVTSNHGCIDSINKGYSVYTPPKASFDYSPFNASTLVPEINFLNTSSSFVSQLWTFDDSSYSILKNPSHEFESAGNYDVVLAVTDSNQCVDSIVKTITMYYDFVLFLPNSFTPDNNGVNDNYGPKGIRMQNYKSYEFSIFNRWGQSVFFSDNITEQWDGLDVMSGIYSWSIVIIDELGAMHKRVGEVMLIK